MFDDDNTDSGDIDALNSILNWEEDDETAVASSVEATTNALAQREQPQHFFPQPDPIPANNGMFNPFQQQQWSLPGMPQQTVQFFMQNSRGQQQAAPGSIPNLLPPSGTPANPSAGGIPSLPLPLPLKAATGSVSNPLPPAAASSNKPLSKNNVVSCSSDPDEPSKKTSSSSHTANLTPEEKAKVNRDRNREHARNTRLRKKQYLENLKKSLSELGKERDIMVRERAAAANMMAEMTKTRTEVLLSFFALRSMFEKRREMWGSVLDEAGFRCVLPVTPYRSFPSSEVQVDNIQRTIMGIDGMIADTASLHIMMNNLVNRDICPNGHVRFSYTLVTEDSVVAGNQIMARWIMTTLNATQCGARSEVCKKGMLCCKFNSAHRIVSLELMFDVMAFMLQLKQSCGNDSFCVVPNTVRTCQRVFQEPMVITMAEYPYTIVQVNQNWEEMTGYKAEEVVGKHSCNILQGNATNGNSVRELMQDVMFKRPAMAQFVNYTKTADKFHHHLSVYPLSSDSKITHCLGLTMHYRPVHNDSPVNVISTESMSSMLPNSNNQANTQNNTLILDKMQTQKIPTVNRQPLNTTTHANNNNNSNNQNNNTQKTHLPRQKRRKTS